MSAELATKAPFSSEQTLVHYTAGCFDCGASLSARNAQAWAHQHVQKTGHSVELSLGWMVAPGFKRARAALSKATGDRS